MRQDCAANPRHLLPARRRTTPAPPTPKAPRRGTRRKARRFFSRVATCARGQSSRAGAAATHAGPAERYVPGSAGPCWYVLRDQARNATCPSHAALGNKVAPRPALDRPGSPATAELGEAPDGWRAAPNRTVRSAPAVTRSVDPGTGNRTCGRYSAGRASSRRSRAAGGGRRHRHVREADGDGEPVRFDGVSRSGPMGRRSTIPRCVVCEAVISVNLMGTPGRQRCRRATGTATVRNGSSLRAAERPSPRARWWRARRPQR